MNAKMFVEIESTTNILIILGNIIKGELCMKIKKLFKNSLFTFFYRGFTYKYYWCKCGIFNIQQRCII